MQANFKGFLEHALASLANNFLGILIACAMSRDYAECLRKYRDKNYVSRMDETVSNKTQRLRNRKRLGNRIFILFSALFLLTCFSYGLQSAQGVDGIEWPMFRYDPMHTGYSNSTAPDTKDLLWKYSADSAVLSSPAVSSGRLYVGGEKGNFYCLNALTGARIWSYPTGVWSSPSVSNNRVYFGSNTDNRVYCLNALDGKPIWNYTTGASIGSSPTVVEGRLYIGAYDGNGVYCLDALTGVKLWNYATTGQVWSSPVVAYGYVFVGDLQGHTVYCIDAVTGTKIWNYTTDGMVWSSPTVVQSKPSPGVIVGRVYVGSADNSTYCLDAETGSLIWSYKTGGYVESSPAVFGGRVYIGSFDKKVYCLDASTGALIWSYATEGAIWSSPAIADGKIYFGSYDFSVYCLDASTGAKFWSYKTGEYVFSSPAVVDGRVYIGSADGNVYCFAPVKPEAEVWVPSTQGAAVAATVTVGTVAAASVLASAVTSAVGSGTQGLDRLGDKIYDLLPDALKSWLEDFISSKHKTTLGERSGSIFIPMREEVIAYAVTVVALTMAYAYVRAPAPEQIWESVPLILVTSILFVFAKTYIITVISRRFGVWTEHRLWSLGLFLFAFSTLVLKVPFSYPSRLDRSSSNLNKRIGGLLSSASIMTTFAFAFLFYIVYRSGFTLVGNIGMILCLTTAFFEALPVAPMGGKDIYDWKKVVWGLLFAASVSAYAASLLIL